MRVKLPAGQPDFVEETRPDRVVYLISRWARAAAASPQREGKAGAAGRLVTTRCRPAHRRRTGRQLTRRLAALTCSTYSTTMHAWFSTPPNPRLWLSFLGWYCNLVWRRIGIIMSVVTIIFWPSLLYSGRSVEVAAEIYVVKRTRARTHTHTDRLRFVGHAHGRFTSKQCQLSPTK